MPTGLPRQPFGKNKAKWQGNKTMTDKFETMKSTELLLYIFGDNSPKRFVPTIVPMKNDLGRSRGYWDMNTGDVWLHKDLVDKAITMRMLEICESERKAIKIEIENQVGNYDDLIEQLAVYDRLIDEVNENTVAVLARYEKFKEN